MLYYLALNFTPHLSFLNAFTYHTVRAGGALVTGFLICVLLGPRVIEALRALKIGQHIKKDHVQDLHELHKGKAGTPTMGGALMILSTLLSLLIWSTLTNRLLLVATGVLCLMGAVGFIDDYIKLRRKHNDGLSARAKIVGQVITGALLGLFAVISPVTYGASYLSTTDITNWQGLAAALGNGDDTPAQAAISRFGDHVSQESLDAIEGGVSNFAVRNRFLLELNDVMDYPGVYDKEVWDQLPLADEANVLLAKGTANLNRREVVRLNRLLLECAAPGFVGASRSDVHTSVALPGFKEVLIPMGFLYIVFVIFVIVAMSNAVNVTDGLDGLAAGASVISILTFTGIAYVISRADWSDYLYVMHVPEASELTVFGSALIGTGLGFLWFNAHPAEVFMGDTGSLALGGVIGAMAILTKQELLLPIVGGLFVMEAGSVVLQVASFKLRKKRIFRMAPLHHHFELNGWSETKVVIRFWIIALMFALLSLSTLKLR